MSAPAEASIDALFATAVTHLLSVDDTWPALSHLAEASPAPPFGRNPEQTTAAAAAAIASLERVSSAVQSAALLSSNEALDEIPTRSLKFLLLPYLRARAHAQVHGEPRERHAALATARALLEAFFARADALRMLSERERDVALEGTPTAAATAAERREVKIARFREEKAAARRLEVLRGRVREAEEGDDEAEREAALVVVQSAVRGGLEMLGSIEEEMRILSYAVREMERGRDPRESAEKEDARNRSGRKGAGGVEGMPANFRIVSEREKIKEGVFRPSHSLPTYTVEEWGEIEMRRAVEAEREKREREVATARRRGEEDSDGDEAVDRETVEKRRWDDWADEHNRGSGNSMR